jgi:DNA-binding CsgD family transcriptional regulator
VIAEGAHGPLDEQLARRCDAALRAAAELLGAPAPDLIAAGAAVRARLAEGGDAAAWAELGELHERRLELVRRRYARRREALDEVRGAVGALRAMTSPSAMAAGAPAELGAASGFDRVLLSWIRAGTLAPEAAWVREDPPAAARLVAALGADPLRLEHPMVETEVMRRGRATLVLDAQLSPRVHPRLTAALGWTSFAAAPLAVGGRVVGFLHADREPDGPPVDAVDRDVLWAFAGGFAHAFESAGLRRTLRREREDLRRFLDALKARSSVLSEAAIDLAADEVTAASDPVPGAGPGRGHDDRVVLADLLTRRELDVMRLMAEGRTNAAIAAELVLTEGTVKFHVSNLLRKLRAGNRADAVSRYLRLTAGPP